jgi:hypothetical protein
MHESPVRWAAPQHPEVDVNGSSGPFMSIDTNGGLQTFAASARAMGQSGESGRSMRSQIHKCCKQSNGGTEPILQNFSNAAKGCFPKEANTETALQNI